MILPRVRVNNNKVHKKVTPQGEFYGLGLDEGGAMHFGDRAFRYSAFRYQSVLFGARSVLFGA